MIINEIKISNSLTYMKLKKLLKNKNPSKATILLLREFLEGNLTESEVGVINDEINCKNSQKISSGFLKLGKAICLRKNDYNK